MSFLDTLSGDTKLPDGEIPLIDSAMLRTINDYADEAGYGYDRVSAESAKQGSGLADSTWYRLGPDDEFTMRLYRGPQRHATVGEDALVEVNDFHGDGTFFRIYSVVIGAEGYELSDT